MLNIWKRETIPSAAIRRDLPVLTYQSHFGKRQTYFRDRIITKSDQSLFLIWLLSVSIGASYAQSYSQISPSPSYNLDSQLREMEAFADRLTRKSQFHPPVFQSYWSNNPTLGAFSHDGSTAHILYINGARVNLKECGDVNTLKSLVASGLHRHITGQELPGGYILLYPENIEEIARNAKCRSR